MSMESDRERFWAYATTFGALWGAIEATAGSFLHALKVPFAGTLLAACGATLLVALRVLCPRRGVVLAAGLVCALVKLTSPGTVLVGPMVGIVMESLLVEIACLPLGAKAPTAVLGGALATAWALVQKVLTQVVLFGAPVILLYREVLVRAEAWLGLPRTLGVTIALPFLLIVMAIGGLGGLVGLSAGRRVEAEPDGAWSKAPSARERDPGTPLSDPGMSSSPRRARVRVTALLAVLVAALLFVALVRAPVRAHGGAFALAYGVACLFGADLRKRIGGPKRWVFAVVVLASIGALVGPKDAHLLGRGYSSSASLAGVTMSARAFALVLASSGILLAFPPAELVTRIAEHRRPRLVRAALVALSLVPELVTTVRTSYAVARRERPRFWELPARLFACFVAIVRDAGRRAQNGA